MDGGISVFRNTTRNTFGISKTVFPESVSKWMVVFPDLDGGVSVFRVVFPESVSKWMMVFRCFQTVFRSGWWCFEMDGNVGGVSSKSVSK